MFVLDNYKFIMNVYHVKFRENSTNVDTNYECVSNFES